MADAWYSLQGLNVRIRVMGSSGFDLRAWRAERVVGADSEPMIGDGEVWRFSGTGWSASGWRMKWVVRDNLREVVWSNDKVWRWGMTVSDFSEHFEAKISQFAASKTLNSPLYALHHHRFELKRPVRKLSLLYMTYPPLLSSSHSQSSYQKLIAPLDLLSLCEHPPFPYLHPVNWPPTSVVVKQKILKWPTSSETAKSRSRLSIFISVRGLRSRKVYTMHFSFKHDKLSTVAAGIVRREQPGHNSSSSLHGLSVAAFGIPYYIKPSFLLWFRVAFTVEKARCDDSIPGGHEKFPLHVTVNSFFRRQRVLP